MMAACLNPGHCYRKSYDADAVFSKKA